jgi:hypothetical protein
MSASIGNISLAELASYPDIRKVNPKKVAGFNADTVAELAKFSKLTPMHKKGWFNVSYAALNLPGARGSAAVKLQAFNKDMYLLVRKGRFIEAVMRTKIFESDIVSTTPASRRRGSFFGNKTGMDAEDWVDLIRAKRAELIAAFARQNTIDVLLLNFKTSDMKWKEQRDKRMPRISTFIPSMPAPDVHMLFLAFKVICNKFETLMSRNPLSEKLLKYTSQMLVVLKEIVRIAKFTEHGLDSMKVVTQEVSRHHRFLSNEMRDKLKPGSKSATYRHSA